MASDIRNSKLLRRDLLRFTDRFCGLFSQGVFDEKENCNEMVEDAGNTLERILLEQLHPSGKPKNVVSLSDRLQATPGRRAFRMRLENDELKEQRTQATRLENNCGITIRSINNDNVNVGVCVDGNTSTSHFRRVCIKQPAYKPSTVTPKVRFSSLSRKSIVEQQAILRRTRVKPAPLHPQRPQFTPLL
eukprot:TRINITY_DN25731_c0_g1_i1.p1 TRINITY_DN25731_c0_g1~~TRINITY_DN25731_c0_g1_i1.p1  ORF type:complete len:189 (+),score=29.56 TRINITY_DN25731_c0_g1_i1:45-611(+)